MSMIGRTLSHYKVLEEISRGGMGIVYKALDLKLNREVALKVLPPELVADPERKRRFVQEAQAAAALKHPNIGVVYEIDEIDGVDFIAMELIEGEKLSEALERGPLSLLDGLRVGKEVAEGLANAHQKGVIHRDIKPANIMRSREGHAKIIDFGLAKLIESVDDAESYAETIERRETVAGALLGTIHYMSPEQARGQAIDHRSDIFSFGILLYEMLSGQRPFEGSTAADTLGAILNQPPKPLTTAVPKPVRRILERCLQKEPERRFANATDLLCSLQDAEASLGRGHSIVRVLVAASIVAAAVAAGTWWFGLQRTSRPQASHEVVSVLIADFDNRTGESVFDGAIEQALAISLEGAPFVTAYDRARARQQVSTLSPESSGRLGETEARLVCRSQGIELVLTGTIETDGSGYVVRASAIDAVTAEVVAGATETVADKARVLRAVDRLASDLRADLGDIEPASRQAFQDETFTTSSLDAMQAYAAAQDLLHSGKSEEALQTYEEAVTYDPEFGRAYTGIGVALWNLDRREEARPYFEKALSLIHRMTSRERLLTRGLYYMFTSNYTKAIDEYTELIHEFPSEDASNLSLAYFYEHNFEKALETGRRNVVAEPTLIRRLNAAIYATYAGQLDEAVEEGEAVIRENPAYQNAYVTVALARLANEESEEAAQVYHRLSTVDERGASLAALGLADVAIYEGRVDEAKRLLSAFVEKDVDRGNHFAAAKKLSALAEAELLQGQPGEARETMERARTLSQDLGTRFRAASVCLQTGDETAASELITGLASEEDSESKALAGVLRGEAALLEGNPKKAVPILLEAREIADTWLGRLTLGRVYLETGAFAEANSELEACLRRRGEATALFLDDVPTYRVVPEVYYYLGLSQEGLGSRQGAADSYQTYLRIKEQGDDTELIRDARRRVALLR